MTDHQARVDEFLADYRRSREHLACVHQELGAISASASSADGSVTATVGPRGTLTGLHITDDAYQRYRPAELAKEIVRVTAVATVQALSDASEVLAPALPAGTDPQALLLGTADLGPDEIAPEHEPASAVPAPVKAGRKATAQPDDDDDFEDTNWVFDAGRAAR